jgi:HK97 family phage major capsid protein
MSTQNQAMVDVATQAAIGAIKSEGAHTASFALGVMGQGALAREQGAAGGIARIRVMGKSESFSHVKSALATKSGAPAQAFGKQLESASDWERVKSAVWLKFIAKRGGAGCELTDFDKAVLAEMVERDHWAGEIGGRYVCGVEPNRVKALLDDSTSGGSYVNPTFFDDLIVQTPVLFGELFPMVSTIDVSHGSSVDGASFTAPAVSWGTTEGSAFSVVSTSGMFANCDTTIFPCVAAIEVGRDWLSDVPVNVGNILLNALGEALQNSLDYTIAVGDGATQPTGIFTAAGSTSVAAANGTAGPISPSDIEALMFGISKAMRSKANNCCFVMTDRMYRRCRSIAVGTSDARRLFGMDYGSYMLADWPVKINNSITNGQMAFAALRFYRMYRRLGIALRWTSEGQTLSLKNASLLVLRARYGGKPTLGASICKMTDAAIVG